LLPEDSNAPLNSPNKNEKEEADLNSPNKSKEVEN